MGYRLAVDTGGTFTDLCLVGDGGEHCVGKLPSTPEDPSRAVLQGIGRILAQAGVPSTEVTLLLHGTTVATNAVLEGKGARTALVTTRGFRDVIYIGRQNRPHLYNFRKVKPPPLIPRELVLEADERVLPGGEVRQPLTEQEADKLVNRLLDAGVDSVAVCLLHSYANPSHERLLGQALHHRKPGLCVTLSSDILPEYREYERTATTVLNALVSPRVREYLGRLERALAETAPHARLFIMQSNGGVITPAAAREQSARTILSGPAGGVRAGITLARMTGIDRLITMDMGGTSTDVALLDGGEAPLTGEGSIAGYPLRLPMLDLHTVGAGGGSVAWVDAGGALRVGPVSAGADPGPACYGLGGEQPTVTDANLVLGRMGVSGLAGGKVLRPDLAARAIEGKVAAPLGLSLEKAAEGIIQVVNANMVRAIRAVSVQRGYDPREFTLVPFGGAGPLHAGQLARELSMSRILIPAYPGATSAWGMLSADVRHDWSQTRIAVLTPNALEDAWRELGQMAPAAEATLADEGFGPGARRLEYLIDLRYQGQSHELTLILPEEPASADAEWVENEFHRLHKRRYGYSRKGARLEIVTLRLAAFGLLSGAQRFTPVAVSKARRVEERPVYLGGSYIPVPVRPRESLEPGALLEGPAVISQLDSTILLLPGDRARCDQWGNILVEAGARS